MKAYIGIVHKSPETAYGITFPDAPGCFSAADEIDDLFPMAEEAILAWTEAMLEEDLVIPAPRELSEIRADRKWLESLETSAFLIAIPAPPGGAQQRAA